MFVSEFRFIPIGKETNGKASCPQKAKPFETIGATERISNNLNPDFKTTIQALYFFERNQKFKFEVVDDDGSGSSDPIGSVETTMGNIMGSRAQTYVTDLIGHGKSHSLG